MFLDVRNFDSVADAISIPNYFAVLVLEASGQYKVEGKIELAMFRSLLNTLELPYIHGLITSLDVPLIRT
jgi:hypothetical protein